MHGRLKVRTSAEEAIRKKKEQDLKAKAYRNGTDKILALRHKENQEQPLLELTSKLLSVNPDVATLWNIRRECILSLMRNADFDASTFERDLGFTELCLQVQPKSYGAWHHRVWILENSPEPNWEREVKLCSLYLKKDERNFHCWDYRRFVVEKAKISAEKEFEFCDEKIMKNFSNYSSWHYRSKLLPQLHPHESDPTRPISEEKLKEELELVITAAFTDPNDSSSWFYQRWLLGFSELRLDLAAAKITNRRAIIAFTKPIELTTKNGYVIRVAGDEIDCGEWKALSGGKSDSVWIREGSYAIESEFIVSLSCDASSQTYELATMRVGDALIGIKLPAFGYEFNAAVKEVLRNQLDSCNQLLEYEPDSKWTLLTAALLMRSLDRFQYHQETLNHLKKLQKVDELRAGYYADLASKWTVECKLRNWVESNECANGRIDLSNLDLTTVYYSQFFVIARHVDVSGNLNLNRHSCIFQQIDGCLVDF